jgi:hypothetical protein
MKLHIWKSILNTSQVNANMSLTDAYNTVKCALSTAPPPDAYLRWGSPRVNTVKPDEDQNPGLIGGTMNKMQQHKFGKHRHTYRATHVKTQGIVKGKLKVLSDLSVHLRQGLLSEPERVYDIAARYVSHYHPVNKLALFSIYANEPVFLQPDQAPGPRGLSMRVFNISGQALNSPLSSANTQDFFFNNAPMIC